MNCQETRQDLLAYKRGETVQIKTDELENHLLGCSECQKWTKEIRLVEKALVESPTEKSVEDLPSVQSIQNYLGRRKKHRIFFFGAIAASALILIAIVGYFLMRPPAPPEDVYKIEGGFVQVFKNTVVNKLHGFELERGRMHVQLKKADLHAAKKITIQTKAAKIEVLNIDAGELDFNVEVESDGKTVISVVKGVLEIKGPMVPLEKLTAHKGEAILLSAKRKAEIDKLIEYLKLKEISKSDPDFVETLVKIEVKDWVRLIGKKLLNKEFLSAEQRKGLVDEIARGEVFEILAQNVDKQIEEEVLMYLEWLEASDSLLQDGAFSGLVRVAPRINERYVEKIIKDFLPKLHVKETNIRLSSLAVIAAYVTRLKDQMLENVVEALVSKLEDPELRKEAASAIAQATPQLGIEIVEKALTTVEAVMKEETRQNVKDSLERASATLKLRKQSLQK